MTPTTLEAARQALADYDGSCDFVDQRGRVCICERDHDGAHAMERPHPFVAHLRSALSAVADLTADLSTLRKSIRSVVGEQENADCADYSDLEILTELRAAARCHDGPLLGKVRAEVADLTAERDEAREVAAREATTCARVCNEKSVAVMERDTLTTADANRRDTFARAVGLLVSDGYPPTWGEIMRGLIDATATIQNARAGALARVREVEAQAVERERAFVESARGLYERIDAAGVKS